MISPLQAERDGVVELHHALVEVARETDGGRVAVQPIAALPNALWSAAAHGLAILGATGLGLLWAWVGVVVLLATLGSAVVELGGGRGWVRQLAPRQLRHNVILWRLGPDAGPRRPRLVVYAPAAGGPRARDRGPLPFALLALPWAAGALGLSLSGLAPAASGLLLGLGLGLGALFSLALLALALRSQPTEPNDATLLLLAGARAARALSHLDLCFAFGGGGASAHDAMEVLLRNHLHRIEPARTRVLALQPTAGPLCCFAEEAWLPPIPADRLLLEEARAAGIPASTGRGAATRASRAGWRALGLGSGDEANRHAATEQLAALLHRIDAAVAEGRW